MRPGSCLDAALAGWAVLALEHALGAIPHAFGGALVFNRAKDWQEIDGMVAAGTTIDVGEVLRWVGRVGGDDEPNYGRIAAVLTHR